MTSLRVRASAGLLEALGRMAYALADKKFDQGAHLERSVETLNEWDVRRRRKEDRALKLLDESSKIKASGDAVMAFARQVRSTQP